LLPTNARTVSQRALTEKIALMRELLLGLTIGFSAGVSPGPHRSYDRAATDLRPVEIEPGFVRSATGSALIATHAPAARSTSDSTARRAAGSPPSCARSKRAPRPSTDRSC